MDIKTLVQDLDAHIVQGNLIKGIQLFYADNVITSDYKGVQTINKIQIIEKTQAIINEIDVINDIILHHTLVDGSKSISEFTFDFYLKSKTILYWHEIIYRSWGPNGKVIKEKYFNSNNSKV